MRSNINIANKSAKPRIAASHYLNSAPLIWSFIHGTRGAQVSLMDAVPSRCAELLAQGEVECALVPVIEYQRIDHLVVVPDVCVGSRQKVLSVVLASRKKDLREILSVALDESSRTSATLLKIIFREFVDSEPRWNPSLPDLKQMLADNDAALIIGDPGMTFNRQGLRVFDMATIWREFTGLGFVFAMWMLRSPVQEHLKNIDFAAIRDEGLADIEAIISYYQRSLPLSPEQLRTYLTENIAYHLEQDMKDGMQRYFELAAKHKLIDCARPLEFV